jgi:zinc/manganese transport system substrate-binding protein
MLKRLVFCFALIVTSTIAQAQVKLETIASMSIIGDFVQKIGGERVQVTTLVGAGGDTHTFQPAPQDARRMAQAKLVFINGLGLEGWLPRLVQSSGSKAKVVTVSTGVKAIREASDGHGHGHGHGLDPHAWQDISNAKLYARNIRDALSAADPEGASFYTTRTEAYMAELDQLDREIKQGLAQIPAERRRIITSHDAFGYFAKAYSLSFVAPQGVSTEAEASSRDVARIIRQVRAQKIPAVFLENISDPRLMTQIAHETGAKIGPRIFSDSLSDSSGPAPTYLDMMRHNLRAFVEALR